MTLKAVIVLVLVLLLGTLAVAGDSSDDCDFWCTVEKFFSGPVAGKAGGIWKQ